MFAAHNECSLESMKMQVILSLYSFVCRCAAELQFTHYKVGFSSAADAFARGDSDAVVIVSVLLDLAQSNNANLDDIIAGALTISDGMNTANPILFMKH